MGDVIVSNRLGVVGILAEVTEKQLSLLAWSYSRILRTPSTGCCWRTLFLWRPSLLLVVPDVFQGYIHGMHNFPQLNDLPPL